MNYKPSLLSVISNFLHIRKFLAVYSITNETNELNILILPVISSNIICYILNLCVEICYMLYLLFCSSCFISYNFL